MYVACIIIAICPLRILTSIILWLAIENEFPTVTVKCDWKISWTRWTAIKEQHTLLLLRSVIHLLYFISILNPQWIWWISYFDVAIKTSMMLDESPIKMKKWSVLCNRVAVRDLCIHPSWKTSQEKAGYYLISIGISQAYIFIS